MTGLFRIVAIVVLFLFWCYCWLFPFPKGEGGGGGRLSKSMVAAAFKLIQSAVAIFIETKKHTTAYHTGNCLPQKRKTKKEGNCAHHPNHSIPLIPHIPLCTQHHHHREANIAWQDPNSNQSITQITHLNNNCLLVGCLMSQQHASVSQGRICTILHAATLR